MKKSQYWMVAKTHDAAAYNDNDEYAIVTGEGTKIASVSGNRAELLNRIVKAHNMCFLENSDEQH